MIRIGRMLNVLVSSAVWILAYPQSTGTTTVAGLHRIEREITDRLRWEILWNESSVPIRPRTSTTLAAYLTQKSLFYCAHDLAKCAEYSIEDSHLGQRRKNVKCDESAPPCKGSAQDTDAVGVFVRQSDPELPTALRTMPPRGHTLGGTLAGTPTKPTTPVLWTMTIQLGSRQEIVDRYRQSPPAELEGLRQRFRVSIAEGTYKAITIPCYSLGDPEVYLYAERVARGPMIISVRWDKEREEWEYVGLLEVGPIQGVRAAQKIEELRSIIEAMPCATLKAE